MKLTLLLFTTFFSVVSLAQELDLTFTTDGVAPYGGPNANGDNNERKGTVLAIQDDGKLVVGTSNKYYNDNDFRFYTYRYMPDGTPDPTFGVNGVSDSWIGRNAICNDLEIQDDGKIVIVGESEYCTGGVCGANQFIMYRLMPNGDLDSTFGVNGRILTEDIFGSSATYTYPYGLEILSNGQFLIAGRSPNSDPFVARLNSDGSLDLSYATNGYFEYTDYPGGVVDLLIDENEEPMILTAQWSSQDQAYSGGVHKLNGQGELDNSFGGNGSVEFTVNGYSKPTSFDMMDGDIVIVGKSEYQAFCHRLTSDGSVAPGFQGGVALETASDSITVFNKVEVVNEENILVSGYILNHANGQYLYEALVGLLDGNGNWSTDFNQTGYMHLDYGQQATTGWTGKVAEAFDVDFTENDEIYITGKRNPTPGHTKQTLLLVKLKDVPYTPVSNLSVSELINDDMMIYPNPAQDHLFLSQVSDVSILDINGHQLFEKKSTSEIAIDHLSSGVYLLKVNGVIHRFVKE